jgi:superoxide reductase
MKFYLCETCGNIITHLETSGVNVVCCGKKMTEVAVNTTDAAKEKHVPVVTVEGTTVTALVGSVAHPMTEEHGIRWVILETNQGFSKKDLAVGAEPKAVFTLAEGETPIAVYEYCNLHGIWKTEL